jgi:small subunit ribosomal protein S6
MALPAPTYDLTLLLDTAADADRRTKIVSDAKALIEQQGSLVGHHEWGSRPTTYEIDKKTEAEYHLVQFKGPRALLEELDRVLPITDGVLRYRIIRLAPGTPTSVPDLKAEPREEAVPESQPQAL